MKREFRSLAVISTSLLALSSMSFADPKPEPKETNKEKRTADNKELHSDFEIFIDSLRGRVLSIKELEDSQPSCGGVSSAK
jgi:hypothetical protein